MIAAPENPSDAPRVWIVSELYYPEETSTGHVMTCVAEAVARRACVKVLCGQPSYSQRNRTAPSREIHNGVDIRRSWSTRFDKNRIAGRMLNMLTLSWSVFICGVAGFRAGDRVLVVTNPPSLPFVVRASSFLRRSRCFLLVHDVHPEQLVATGMARDGSPLVRILTAISRLLYRSMDGIVVIGRDMAVLARQKLRGESVPVSVITNWADADEVRPLCKHENPMLESLGLQDSFVVLCAGNLGRPNAVEAIIDTAERMLDRSDVSFLIVGSGAKRSWTESAVRDRKLVNVIALPPVPRTRQSELLTACDVSIVPLVSGMYGLGVPSRAYNALAAGRPVIALVDRGSELALLVEEHDVGWYVPADEPAELERVIRAAADDVAEVKRKGANARNLAETRLARDTILADFVSLLVG